jgi:transposase
VIQITPHMRILVAVEPQDFRRGIDGLARICRQELGEDPFSGTLFLFRNRRGTAVKLLVFDSQGFWLAQKRLSAGRFRFWPTSGSDEAVKLESQQLQLLLSAGDPDAAASAAPPWRRVSAEG